MGNLVNAVMELVGKLIKPFSWIAEKLESKYDGPLKGVPQAIFVIGMAIIIFSPWLVYVTLISLNLPPPYCYLSFLAWFGYIGLIGLIGLYIDYSRGKELMKSFSKKWEWNTSKHFKEYLKVLEKKEGSSNN